MQHTTEAARVLMGDSLGFHIIFVMLGLTFPVLVSWFELSGILRKNKQDTEVAKFWSKIMGLLVITGVVSGTIIALQMSLVWPGILKFGGQVIGLPFMFETYAFLIEATFLALYLTTWGKVKPLVHWLFGAVVVIGSTMSAYAITSVNAWMNYPSGFDYIHGQIVHVNVWAAMFSRTSIVEFVHSMPGYYLAASLLIMSVYAVRLARASLAKRRSKTFQLDRLIVHRLMIFAGIMLLFCAITGDLTGKYLAKYEPVKLATIELNHQTRSNAPLLIGGVGQTDGTVVGPHFEVPGGLSLLAGNSTKTSVQGIDATPTHQRPSLILHTFFDIKMTLLDAVVAVIILYFAVYWLRRQWLQSRLSLFALSIIGVSAIAMVELGWMLTEIGRQPWAVRGYVTTADAVTKSHTVTSFAYIFPMMYVVLFVFTLLAIRRFVAAEKSRPGGTL